MSTESTTVKLNIPPSLVFLIANIHSFVTLKLDSHNYVLWRAQMEHALKANNFFGFVNGTIPCPASGASRTAEISVLEPDSTLWKIVDSQLVSCLIATLSATTLPLILGLEHAFQVWNALEHRFNSLSKTHVHDLRQQLYNVTKTTTLDAYFDIIKELSYKLAAAGTPVTDDELVFHALHGLPSEFDPLQTALGTRIGSITFDELITIVNGEEMRRNRAQSIKPVPGSSSVFVTMPASANSAPQPVMSSYSVPHGAHNQTEQPPPMYQAIYPQQQQRNWSTNRQRDYRGQNRGSNSDYRGQNRGSNAPCQICNKTNHTAKTCYYRSNLNYQPPSASHYNHNYSPSQQILPNQPMPQAHMLQYNSPMPTFPCHTNTSQTGLLSLPQPYNTNTSQPYPSVYSTNYSPPNHYPFAPTSSQFAPSSSAPSGNWYLDSGATHHVTNDLANLSLQQAYSGSTGVMVGNGHTIPISHAGQNNKSDSPPRPHSQGFISNSGLF